MAHDLFKLGVTLVVLAIVIIIMALFVSGYLSAFKHGGKNQTPSIPAGIAGGKGGRVAVASPTPRPGPAYNVSMSRAPSGPMIPAAPQAPPAWSMQPGGMPWGGAQPGGVSPGGARQPVPSPRASPSPQPSAAPAPPSQPSGEGPAMANSPYATVWELFIDQIIRMLAAAVPAQNSIFPAWPQSGVHI